MTPMIGRSHGVHAEPITFGLKLALMFDEFGRAAVVPYSNARAHSRRQNKRRGLVHADVDPKIERAVC